MTNDELFRKRSFRRLIRWTLIVGIPILFAAGNGIRAYLMTQTGGEFFGFDLIFNFVIGCIIGGCIGMSASAVFWAFTRPFSFE